MNNNYDKKPLGGRSMFNLDDFKQKVRTNNWYKLGLVLILLMLIPVFGEILAVLVKIAVVVLLVELVLRVFSDKSLLKMCKDKCNKSDTNHSDKL